MGLDNSPPEQPEPIAKPETAGHVEVDASGKEKEADATPPPQDAGEQSVHLAREQDDTHASMLADELSRYHADMFAGIVQRIRKIGKETSFTRMTTTEKQQLTDVLYAYRRKGIKTSETEINRIAINYLLEDYRKRGEASILAQILATIYV